MSRRRRDDTRWHQEQVRKACRALFAAEGTVEEALSAVLEAARREYGWHITIHHPCELVIDGYPYQWPLDV
jgi:hypothetical protein